MIGPVLDGGDAQAVSWDFFISYTRADRPWAEWIAWELEEAGYHVMFQAWDSVPGSNWNSNMQHGITRAVRTIAVLSREYLKSVFGESEWQAAYRDDPQGFERKLLPIRVENCNRPGVLGSVVSIDLFDRPPEIARNLLLEGIRQMKAGRAKPAAAPRFPGPESRQVPSHATVRPERSLGRRRPYTGPPLERRRRNPPTKLGFYFYVCFFVALAGAALSIGTLLGISKIFHTHFSQNSSINVTYGGALLFVPIGVYAARWMIRTGAVTLRKSQ
ncbi:toll/interleukin-1 receptor domain-containing protein [Frankia tisae]|uniref:toll/interleukin-1 receptor domain-containing protein n=1 Tax=Frankia tisae TaxID=2950104 RepID=UPI0021C01BAB|nr:toll/interleukin-1 receptor domain-containing protein [Frankia tisae]